MGVNTGTNSRGRISPRRAAWRAITVGTACSAAGALALLAGCASSGSGMPKAANPEISRGAVRPAVTLQTIDLSQPGAVAWTTINPIVVDTRDFPVQVQDVRGVDRRVKTILPAHQRPNLWRDGQPNALVAGGLNDEREVRGVSTFSGIDRTGWNPPDPAIAVGPNHVVEVVNQSLAFYTKSGTLQFQAVLGSQGNPGFFEDVGAESFAFDPKCFYDHYSERFIVLVLETYSPNEAYVTFAVSDDSDPNGVWYKYRTDAVITAGSNTFWWDYPGLGYDEDAWYVTSNLFPLSGPNNFGGVGYRVFSKNSMLSGGPAQFATLRDPGSGSVQIAQHFGGDNQAPFFVSTQSGSSLRINAITNPLTNPQLQSTSVSVPNFSGPSDAPVQGGGQVSNVDSRIMNVHWRDGQLYAAHTIGTGTGNKARWYHMNTNNWPASGGVSLVQSGNIDPGPGIYTFFPAIYADANQNVAVVYGQSSANEPISMRLTGRQPTNAPGEMGDPVVVRTSTRTGSEGRWGDYYDMAIDPTDGTTFWAIGETDESGIGWDTWITRFSIGDVGFGISLDLTSSIPELVPSDTPFDVEFTIDLGNDTLASPPVLFVGPQGQTPTGVGATQIDANTYRATVPGFDCDTLIEYQIAVIGQSSGNVTLPGDGSSYMTAIGDVVVSFTDNAETDLGYTVSGNALDGQWTRGVPVGGVVGAPDTDADVSGSAWLTDNTPAPSDVDRNSTILTSPAFDFTGGGDMSFYYWLSDEGGRALSTQDGLFIETSNDGQNWVPQFAVNTSASFWRDDTFTVSLNDAGPEFRFRVIARDSPTDSQVEAGIDGISFSGIGCAECVADFDGNNEVNVFDIITFLGVWDVQGPGADFDGNGIVNVFDIITFLGVWNEGCP